MMKKIVGAAAVILMLLGLTSCTLMEHACAVSGLMTAQSHLEQWGIKLPEGYETVYSKHSGPTWNGDGTYYRVIAYPDSKTIEEFPWWNWHPANENYKDWYYPSDAERLLERIDPDKAYLPDLDRGFQVAIVWSVSESKYYLLHEPGTTSLYTIEFVA